MMHFSHYNAIDAIRTISSIAIVESNEKDLKKIVSKNYAVSSH